jgi:hypothetical protein
MKKRIDPLKFFTVVLTVGMFATAGGTSALAMDRNAIGSGRSTAIHDCKIEANKFSSIAQLSNQFAVYGTCMATHHQRFGRVPIEQPVIGPSIKAS